MSIPALNWAFELLITGPKKAVLIALADHADADGKCWPSIARLVQFSGFGERAVRMALRELEQIGLLATVHLQGRLSRYDLAVPEVTPAPDAAPTPARHAALDTGPRHDVPHTPAPDAAPPRHVMPEPRHVVPPNLQEPSVQPSMNHRTLERDAEALFSDAEITASRPAARSRCGTQKADRSLIDAEADEWWKHYPKQVGVLPAKAAYAKARKKVSAEQLLTATRAYAARFHPIGPQEMQWAMEGKRWLAEERWNDTFAPAPPAHQPGVPQPSKGLLSSAQRMAAKIGGIDGD
jgi:hypothetical protein